MAKFSVDLHEIWHVVLWHVTAAFLHPNDNPGYGVGFIISLTNYSSNLTGISANMGFSNSPHALQC